MAHALFQADFKIACRQEGCPLCTLTEQFTRRYLSFLRREHTQDPGVHLQMSQAFGLCPRHAWEFYRLEGREEGDFVGTSLFYGNIIKHIQSRIQRCLETHGNGVRRAHLLRPDVMCLACQHVQENERFQITQFTDWVIETPREEPDWALYLESDGLCIPHLAAVVEKCEVDETTNELLRIEMARLTALREDLAHYAEHIDIRKRDIPLGQAADSPARALQKCGGGLEGVMAEQSRPQVPSRPRLRFVFSEDEKAPSGTAQIEKGDSHV